MTLLLATWEKPGRVAIERGWARRQAGGDLRDCLEAGLAACELNPEFLAIGLGSLPNQDGELELDAAMMDGRDLSGGAVCALRGILPAISVARRVMEDTPHLMLAGDQARRFALAKGMTVRQTMTPRSLELYEEWRTTGAHTRYVHSTDDVTEGSDAHADTVTMLGLEDGHLVAASSTSGLAWKIPGRVGDSPIFGAGLYADDEVGAAGATGHGEELWKACASFRAVEFMRQGMSAQEACEATIRHLVRRQPRGMEMQSVVLAVRKDGDRGAAVNQGNFRLWTCEDGQIDGRTYEGIVR